MLIITIKAAKPNPAGKDKASGHPLPEQLQGEWVDLENTSGQAVRLTGVSLDHRVYGPFSTEPRFALYWKDTEGLLLAPNQVLRIHSGHAKDSIFMAREDLVGAHIHRWSERDLFALNNGATGDKLTVWHHADQWARIDETEYAPFPPEGAILRRIGDRLMPTGASSLYLWR